ncbi:MAG TPA: hypothetical protein VEZ40_15140 [Pyrinomonadaceae bacterium]|nr:hypothetical protein [Pyrinomonadaceae bacterium]
MTKVPSLLVEYFSILGGLVLTQALRLYVEFYNETDGYMYLAIRKLRVLLTLLCAIGWVFAALLFHLLSAYFPSTPRVLLALFAGIVVAAIPNLLEIFLLPAENAGSKQVVSGAARILRKLNLAIRHNFAHAKQEQRQADNIACQSKGGWGLNLTKEQIGRRLRIIYEVVKLEIAVKRRDPGFLCYDTGRTPWEKFYILVKHMGRKRLRHCLLQPPDSPGDDWDGRARRKTRGTKADRHRSTDRNPQASRIYDDEKLMERIRAGKSQLEDSE